MSDRPSRRSPLGSRTSSILSAVAVTPEWIDQYENRRNPLGFKEAGVAYELPLPPPEPHNVQSQALAALEQTRQDGFTAGLVVLATGLGKTWLAAFDSDRFDYRRVLFVAHREEILNRRSRHSGACGRRLGSDDFRAITRTRRPISCSPPFKPSAR